VYSSAAVAVLITLDNWSRWTLVEPDAQVTCGKQAGTLPEIVSPGFSEMALFEKGVSSIKVYLITTQVQSTKLCSCF
jgi:hypothetical protein